MIKDIRDNNNKKTLNQDKIEAMRELFPNCFNSHNQLDLGLLQKELETKVDYANESYELNFLGKSYAKYIAGLDTETVLNPDLEHNQKDENKESQNIYITGDNIDALKHLASAYEGAIKCIYIDPPYNTGTDGFTYNDKFNFDKDTLKDKLNLSDSEADRVLNMTSKGSSSHSAWLTFMWPRLYLARQLLSEDGVIFISIDDNEQSDLKQICDEIFGERNFIACFTWVKKKKGSHLSKKVRSMTEYVLCYSRNYDRVELYGEKAYSNKLQPLAKKTNAHKFLKFDGHCVKTTLRNGVYNEGIYGTGGSALEFKNNFIVKDGQIVNDFTVYGPFTWTQEKLDSELLLGTEVFLSSKYGFNVLRADQENKIKRPTTILDAKSEIGTNEDAYAELEKIFNREAIMSYPKPVSLIEYLVRSISYIDNNLTVLDFFSGSSTTAQAVMKLNAADDGNRKYIMVQLREECKEDSEAFKAGYKSIDELGRARIIKSADMIKEETGAEIDYGFKHYILKDTPDDLLSMLEEFTPDKLVSTTVDVYKQYGVESILETWKLRDGKQLTTPYEAVELGNYTAYKCDDCLYMIYPNITIEDLKELVERYNKDKYSTQNAFTCDKIILFGYSFTYSERKMIEDNIHQIKNFTNCNVRVYTRY